MQRNPTLPSKVGGSLPPLSLLFCKRSPAKPSEADRQASLPLTPLTVQPQSHMRATKLISKFAIVHRTAIAQIAGSHRFQYMDYLFS